MRRTLVRLADAPTLAAADTVASALVRIGTTVPFIRSLPPDTYVTYDPVSGWRHLTFVIDGATQHIPPFSRATFLLRSFLDGDDSSDGSALMYLPHSRKVGDSLRYVERLKKFSAEILDSHHSIVSKRFRYVILPDFNPWVGNSFGLLQQQLNNDVRIATGPCMAAFLSDGTFFKEVRALLMLQQQEVMRARAASNARGQHAHNELVLPFAADEMPFADLSMDQIDIIRNESTIGIAGAATTSGAAVGEGSGSHKQFGRSLTFVDGEGVRSANAGGNHSEPAHFTDKPLFAFDHACKTMFSGDAAGVRLPWAPHIVKDYNNKAGDMLFPVPSAFRYRVAPATLSSSTSGGAASALFRHWDLEDSLETAVRALTRFHTVQRVLSTSYGEIGCDREDVVHKLSSATEALAAIRKRLASKHFTMGISSNRAASHHRGDTLWGPLHKKIWDEVIAVKSLRAEAERGEKVTTPAETEPASAPGVAALHYASVSVLSQLVVTDVATALAASALHVAPAEGAVQSKIIESARMKQREEEEASKGRDVANRVASSLPSSSTSSSSSPSPSTTILEKLFRNRGFENLCPILMKQDIDVDVFLSMSPDELVSTFKVTFGLSKKLQMLQSEVKSKMGKPAH